MYITFFFFLKEFCCNEIKFRLRRFGHSKFLFCLRNKKKTVCWQRWNIGLLAFLAFSPFPGCLYKSSDLQDWPTLTSTTPSFTANPYAPLIFWTSIELLSVQHICQWIIVVFSNIMLFLNSLKYFLPFKFLPVYLPGKHLENENHIGWFSLSKQSWKQSVPSRGFVNLILNYP